ncbi:type IV pili methyl-accepting chemotaxis transducer N-terminal domain-containing protein [Aureispira anguillae]|uniref:Uncharacterized protein n=1 Tax=Aureispira anguillae TaxID=2864201 RepID=A0A916DX13_9BACT|nr:type IV pili methyl-accepting chemotaxis transducer N-terminal domain-containing protein [Aureispira anguillae]BDS15402.1 hypothetical protein AsAng_0061860 [Aureispira anguillae]
MFHSIFTGFVLTLGVIYSTTATPSLNQSHQSSSNLTIREALNKAMRQQTLTQRIAKVYLALNNNLYEPKFYQERDQAIETFQKQLDELKFYTPTDKIKQAIKNVQELWTDYQKIANWSITKKGAEKLLAQCDNILHASKHLVASYEEYAQQLGELYRNSHLIDVVRLIKETGTQRMLTQRIMLFYLAAKQDIAKENSIKKLQNTSKLYSALVEKLASAEINSSAIQLEIKEIQKYWLGLENYIQFFNEDPAYINSMLLLSDELTQKADQVSLLYQDLGKKLSIGKSLNVISYQNMLTQRIAKSYIAITYKYSISKYKRELIASIDLFEEQINSMQRSAQTDEIKEAIQVVNLMWKNYRKLALDWQDMSDIKAGKLLEQSHVIMASCDRVAQAIENYAQTIPKYQSFYEKNGKEVDDKNNIAQQVYRIGLQRTYSQRVAVYIIMNTLGKDSHLSQERLNNCINNYQKNYDLLNSSSINTPHISQTLHHSQKEWTTIVDSSKESPAETIVFVLEHSDHLFYKLDKLNHLYEELMDKLITQ